MDDILTESGEFFHGMLSEGRYYKAFTLEEEVMEHTLRVSNDTELDFARLYGDEANELPEDFAYYSAALLSKRLTVPGIAKVTPEMVLRLSRSDGRMLLMYSSQLEQRRELFRKEAAASEEGHPSDVEDRLSGGGDTPDEPRKDS